MRDGGLMGIGEPLEASRGHAFATHAPSISSAASTMGGGRVRFVRLIRRPGESYGFSLRGGREHGTGFFISHVEVGSEAYMQGLRAGDQLLRVNNLSVERAVHHEVTAMVQGKSSVVLKLKSAGIIPVKEHRGDPLTWLVVDDDEDLSDHGTDTYSQSLPSTHESEHEQFDQASPTQPSVGHGGNENHARVYISCTGKVGLGCSICKGPAEKPGIFVQSVRGGGVARNAGLRPGDQIIACNDVSFTHLEFAEAVYVLKSSPRLVLDVIRGAGLELVAGESSGYNSSASSVAGDQTPPSSSSSEPRDSDHSVTNRLSAVSRHLTLDRSRGWREIESEWAEAEAQEKRRVLQTNQRTLKTRAQRDANHRIGSSLSSRSLGNLSAALREEEDEEQRTAFRDGPTSQAHPSPARGLLTPTHAHYKPALRSTRSSSDVTDDTSHKIALVTSADPHVNNIVVTTGPKNERDAVSRLDQLSNPSASSRTSTLSSGSSQVTVRSSCGSGGSPTVGKAVSRESLVEQQLRELREEQRRLQEEANRLAQERRKFEEEKRRGVERTQSAPLAPLVITCSGQALLPHQQPPPSPTSSIASGRHTTRVLIKSPPPPPPPRKNTTSLSSRSSFHPQQQQVSPPASPAHSSSSSSGVGSSCGSSAAPRRCKSIGSLSASSGESAVWEDSLIPTHPTLVNTHSGFRSSMPPPTPPKPPAHSAAPMSSTNSPYTLGGVPPPPPPPPPQPTSTAKPSLAAALSKELERRSAQEAQSGASEDSKAQVIQEKIDAFKKEKVKSGLGGHNSAQHDKLMQEFKIAHKKMFVSKENLRDISSEEDKEKKETKPEAKPVNHVKVTETPLVQREFTSKIISNSTINKTPLRAMNNVSKTPSLMNGLTTPAKTNFLIRDANSNVNGKTPIANTYSPNVKTSLPSSSPSTNQVSPSSIPLPPPPPPPPPLHHHRSQPPIVPAKPNPKTSVNSPHTQPMSASTSSHSISRPKSMAMSNSGLGHSPHQSRSPASGVPPPPPPMPGMCTLLPPAQQTEQLGGIIKNQSTSAVSTPTKSPLRPHGGVVLDEFRPGEKNSLSVKPPNTYFDAGKQTPGKPLVSIGAYPSPNHRPPPVKMDFLPSASANGEQIAGAAKTSHTPVKVKLQSELESTLSRSNLRQRFAAQELPPDPPSEASGTKQESTSAGYTTTTITNNNTSPSASLSSKYRTLGQDAPSVTIMKGGSGKENEAPDSPPTGILKASGPSSIRPLQKSISFGDVTTVGEDDPRT
ncbi:flocculation protein FLO11-like isoform X1 [Penaeus chinensis]|uniref:flocculation protein FLO11-like isoform X1 n=2 Tax=Penaeus chinensis TaxID=139456 RepID=UPI001FB734CD|nr:flocculation protein FLO11-like isoform X1 [Penaeus chinensis]XP_047499899.1 flocculation protein FLO11-like isoform X1 [Penaeus chinensis]